MQATIYINREDAKTVEEEERDKFIKATLEELGLPLQEIWPEEKLTIEQKQKFRNILQKYDVSIIFAADKSVDIYVGKDCIAKWYKPHFKLRTDHSQIDPSKKLYLEMEINYYSVFEEIKE